MWCFVQSYAIYVSLEGGLCGFHSVTPWSPLLNQWWFRACARELHYGTNVNHNARMSFKLSDIMTWGHEGWSINKRRLGIYSLRSVKEYFTSGIRPPPHSISTCLTGVGCVLTEKKKSWFWFTAMECLFTFILQKIPRCSCRIVNYYSAMLIGLSNRSGVNTQIFPRFNILY